MEPTESRQTNANRADLGRELRFIKPPLRADYDLAQPKLMTTREESNCQLRGDEGERQLTKNQKLQHRVAGKNLNLRTYLWMQAESPRVAHQE
jgi:hypothetical protein